MAESNLHLRLRQTRNRLVDLLGLGQTWPLEDVEVLQPCQKVAFDVEASIRLDPGAPDVIYTLCDLDGNELGAGQAGTGGEICLKSPPITEDVTFRIRADKLHSDNVHSGYQVWLEQQIQVKVGLDTTLSARILEADLLTSQVDPADGAPRIIDHGATVQVAVPDAQEGVFYRLVELPNTAASHAADTPPSDAAVRSTEDVMGEGPGHTLILQSQPFTDDALLAIVATKHFAGSERPTETVLLDTKLPLAVRPDSSLKLRLDPSPLVNWNGESTLVVVGAQAGVEYQAFTRPLQDSDFRFSESLPADKKFVLVNVRDADPVRVLGPKSDVSWMADAASDHPGFEMLGEPTESTGDDDARSWAGLQGDSLAVVQARKTHSFPGSADPTDGFSALELPSAAVALPKPDPDVELQVHDSIPWLLSGGQPGVFYTPVDDQGQELGRPVYFHRWDEGGVRPLGLEHLRVGGDFVVSRDSISGVDLPATTHPVLELDGEPTGSTVAFRAAWARTRLKDSLSQPVALPEPPSGEPSP